MDYEKEVSGIASMVPEDYALAKETRPLAAACLEIVDERYGPDSSHALAFHNGRHSLDVTRRAVELAVILRPYMRPEYQHRVFDLAIIAGASHDYDQESQAGENERNSARFAVEIVEQEDGELARGDFTQRLKRGILATTAPMNEAGEIVQTNLQACSHDPIKFNMAFSDINGIAMEGSRRMVLDATNLYLEIADQTGDSFSVDGLYNFYLTQAGFLRQRLNDGRVKADIAYYFADCIDDVYEAMSDHFNENIKSAYRLAKYIKEHPELKVPIGVAAKGVDISRVGRVAGRILARKVAAEQ